MKNKGFFAILAFLAHKKLTKNFLGNLYRVYHGGFFFTTSTRFIEHKKDRIVNIAIVCRKTLKLLAYY